jgi:hydroxylamine reductase
MIIHKSILTHEHSVPKEDTTMFCYQCEQTLHGTGCVDTGVCGKDAATAVLQDLLIYATKGIAMYASRAYQNGLADREVDVFVVKALFTTVTNVNFHQTRLQKMILQAAEIRDRARALYEQACKEKGVAPQELSGPAVWRPASDIDGLIIQGYSLSIKKRRARLGDDFAGVQELLTYGLKGAAAYYHHALQLGRADATIFAAIHEGLDLLTREDATIEELLGSCLKAGETNLKVMALLDTAHTETFGHPVPTAVRVEPIQGKAIAVSGHDLHDLEALLKQTEGLGINVYTHGEMLPAHGYPKLKAYKHLVGNYGSAWQNQGHEFEAFPGAILMTTNCIQKPHEAYQERIFTSGLVAWPGVQHISDQNFAPVIEAALAAPGFTEDGADKTILVGFGHNTVLGVADKVIEAVKTGAIRHFFLIGGCDGSKPGRNYYAQMAHATPPDSLILTLGCGKYRFNKDDFGTVGGLPRLLDMGQCNDAYSAIQVAVALAGAFGCGVNDLPLSLILSWYEQKAVAILLTLLHLGIRNIRIGPSLPGFITPNVLNLLVENFGIKPLGTVEGDLKAILTPA